MKRAIMIWLLLLALVLTLGPMPARAADAAGTLEQQIRAYADSIDKSGADSTAAKELALHGIRGGGKKLTMDKDDALTAALFNSEMLQIALAESFGEAIRCMQQLDMQKVPGMRIHLTWHGDVNSYNAYMLTGSGAAPADLDWMILSKDYTGTMNAYDNAMEWMVGGADADASIACIRDSGTEKTYRVTVTVYDRFDFHIAETAGFKQFLSGVGMLLFREFDWSCTMTMELTVPYSYERCSHGSGAYRWVYDGESGAMISDGTGSFVRNDAIPMTGTDLIGNAQNYYGLEHTVRLRHDKPWILEYDVRAPKKVVLAAVDAAVAKTYPQLELSGLNTLYAVSKEYVMAKDSDGVEKRFYAYNYYGLRLQELSKLSAQDTYTFRLENEIAADGSNMIWLTVLDTQTGEIRVDRVPMDDHYYLGGWQSETSQVSQSDNWLSGKDLYINYIGMSLSGFKAESFELRIWEDGLNAEAESYYETTRIVEATCAEPGCREYACAACGHVKLEYDPQALGHQLGAWTVQQRPTCTESGSEARSCVRCDYTESRETAPTGHSHTPVITEATCTEDGYTTHTCACGDCYITDEVPALGHRWNVLKCLVCGGDRPNPFVDVTADKWYCESVLWAVENGITSGTTATTFSPEDPCTRAQIVTFLWRAKGSPEPESGENPFADVEASKYYYKAVLWAVENGITSGTSATTFSPNEPCTRAQVATFLWRAEGEPEPETTENPFGDVKTSKYFYKPVLWAVENEITLGTGVGKFSPDDACTRAQIVTFLYRAMGEQ